MALSYNDFIAAFPAFEETKRSLVEAKLVESALQVNESRWGRFQAVGQGYLTAMLLAQEGLGLDSRLQPPEAKVDDDDSVSHYEREFKRLQLIVTIGNRTAGVGRWPCE